MGGNSAQKKPLGAFRGGIVGFFFGFSLVSGYAVHRLLDEYKEASAILQASVEELQATAMKVSAHLERIEAVEKDLKALSEIAVSKEDFARQRADAKKLHDGLHIEFLDLRSHVWGIQQDLQSLSKRERSSVRLV